MTFRLNAKGFLLTYPKCDETKEDLLEFLASKGVLTSYVVARELHQDQSYHLHAYVLYEKKVDTRSSTFFDFNRHHPNVKTAQSAQAKSNYSKYCKKDGDFITNIEEKKGTRQILAETILQEGLTPLVVYQNPTLLFQNFDNLRKWLGFCRPRPPKALLLPKKRHYWVHGKSNTGKTYWLEAFKQLWSVTMEIPTNNDFSQAREAEDCLYWYDEYKGQLTVDMLNKLCDGEKRWNTKGGSITLCEGWVVITSNYSPRECYQNVSDSIIETILNRFIVYDLDVSPGRFPKFPQREL